MCKIKLIDAAVSSHCIHAGNDLYIECSFEALEDFPCSEELELFADFIYGHMTKPENMSNIYRATAKIYPQPMYWKKGEVYTCGLHWQIHSEVFGGSFSINLGLINSDAVPVELVVKDKKAFRYCIGDVEVAFNGCAPKFVNTHMNEKRYACSNPDTENAGCSSVENMVAEVFVRNRRNDNITVEKVIPCGQRYTGTHVSFEINRLEGEEDTVYEMDKVSESTGYELLEVKFGNMFSEKEGQMLTVFGGGRKIDSKTSYSYGYEQKYHQRNVGVLIDSKGEYLIVEAPYLDDKLHHSIYKKNHEPYASIGVTFTYRMRAYGELESVKVINKPTAVVSRKKEWYEVLKYLRRNMKRKTTLYDRTLFYYIEIECDGHKEKMSFKDALERIIHIHNITGGIHQVVLLRGWQHNGHDTGYPDTSRLNPTGGTTADLEYLVDEALKYNAIVTFHDNFDDMYDETEYFDPTIAALDWNGEYFKSWIWVSGISRMVSFPKYVKSGKMAKRVKETVEKYPIKTSYHLDVLSAEIRRYDYAPDIMSAAQESLEYKIKTVREFEKYGFTVTSEGVSYPFSGVIGHAWNAGFNNRQLFYNEEEFPFIAMLFHGYLPYSGGENKNDIIGGAKAAPDIGRDARSYYKERFFKYTLPAVVLDERQIDDYSKEENIYTVKYSGGEIMVYNSITSEVEVLNCPDIVIENGNVIAKGFSDNEYIGYTKSGQMKIDLVDEQQILQILELDYDGNLNEIQYIKENGTAVINAEPDTAFKVVLK